MAKSNKLKLKAVKIKKQPLKKLEKLDQLSAPNHLVSKQPNTHNPWPALQLYKIDQNKGAAFIDERYPVDHWTEWAGKPPSWMDPEIFIAFMLADPRILAAFTECYKVKSKKPAKKAFDLLEEILETQYLPYLFQKFKEVKILLIEYALARFADIEEDKKVKQEILQHRKRQKENHAPLDRS